MPSLGQIVKVKCGISGSGQISLLFHLNLTLLIFTDKMMSKPELLAPHPLNTTVNVGETASLQCKINSEMQPHIQVTR